MMDKVVISLFDRTGNAVKPWADAGYKCFCFDLQNLSRGETSVCGNIEFIHWDAFKNPTLPLEKVKDKNVVFVSCFPPCTDLAVSGARWFSKKEEKNPGTRSRAMSLVYLCAAVGDSLGVPYYIENPVSVISTEWRKPDHSFHPYYFTELEPNDNYTKKTCLWVGNGFKMPEQARDETLGEPDDRIHKAAPSPERANFRSATPMGFAKAVFEANRG